jgi:RimJ/RimL family protein N-acetyltransferase
MAAERPLWTVEWPRPDAVLRALQPSAHEVQAIAGQLAAFYNEPHTRRMLTNTVDLDAGDVMAHYQSLVAAGAAPFLLSCDGTLVGDGDLRHIVDGDAEVAIMIGDRTRQGQGLGTRFGILLHAFAFQALGLLRTFAAIIPENAPSLRLFARLGYRIDDSDAARACADDATDVTLVLDRHTFLHTHSQQLAEIAIRERTPTV